MKDLVIVGSGGFSKEIIWLLERINAVHKTWNFLGCVENEGKTTEPFFGNDGSLLNYDKELYVVFAIGDSGLRQRLYRKFCRNENLRYPNLIDPSVLYTGDAFRGAGNIICANTVMVQCSIGSFNVVNLASTIGHDAVLQDFVTICPGVNISGGVQLASQCEIGTGAQVLQGRTIGSRTKIGAGAVVISDMPENCTAVGVPARIIKYRGD